jgi:hypothetical protein
MLWHTLLQIEEKISTKAFKALKAKYCGVEGVYAFSGEIIAWI